MFSIQPIGVFLNRAELSEFSEFRKSAKSLKHELFFAKKILLQILYCEEYSFLIFSILIFWRFFIINLGKTELSTAIHIIQLVFPMILQSFQRYL